MADPGTFAAAFAALYAAHAVADHWVQTGWQAANKGRRGLRRGDGETRLGRIACARHVGTYVATQAAFLLAVTAVTGMDGGAGPMLAGLTVSAVTHYWADRRFTLAWLAGWLGKGEFYALGAPREVQLLNVSRREPVHVITWAADGNFNEQVGADNPCLGTGAYALDQSWHIGWLFVSALIVAAGAG